jgi:GAF domain-containing protein
VSVREREEHFAELAWRSSQETSDLSETIAVIVNAARATVHADEAGVTLIRPGHRLESMGSTSPEVRQADDFQHELGQGPCVDAATEGRQLVAEDLACDPRWPVWAPKAAGMGLRSILSASLRTAADRRLGALNLYGYQPRTFTDQDQETARLFAAHATAALWAAVREQNLQAALESRTVIGQAEGILMVRYGLDEEQAISVLRRYSQQANTKLRDLARDVVTHKDLPGASAEDFAHN